jgi:hypothetical protein
MPEEVHRRLSAALRAQASGVGHVSGVEQGARTGPRDRAASAESSGRGPAHARPGLSATVVLILAAVFGALAGGLAGVISAW